MKGWPLKLLAEVCEINPRLPRDHGLLDDQLVSFVPMAAVDEVSGKISQEQSRPFSEVRKGYTHFRDGDVLFAKITPCMENGKAAIASELVGGYGFGSTEFHVLRPNPGVMAEWVFYFVRQRSFRKIAKQNFTGTAGQQRVPMTFMSSATIPVPPLPEQRRIVDLLYRAEGIVLLRREAEKKATELIPALFFDMFGDPVTNPKGWDTKELQEVLTETKLGLVRGAKEMADDKPYQYLRMDAVGGGLIRTKGLKRVDAIEPEITGYALRKGDFLFNTRNSKELVGKTGIFVGPEEPPILFNNNLMRMRFDDDAVLPEFVNAQFQTGYIKDQLESIKRGTTTVFAIYYKDLRGIRLRAPRLDLQRDFVSHMQNIHSVRAQQSTATAKAQAAFDALLAQAFML